MKQSHQNSALFCEGDLYALMQPDVRKRLALSDEVDFPALRGQFRGENLPEIYRRLSEIAGADLMPLCETEQQLRQKMRIPADGEQPLNHLRQELLLLSPHFPLLSQCQMLMMTQHLKLLLRCCLPCYMLQERIPLQLKELRQEHA